LTYGYDDAHQRTQVDHSNGTSTVYLHPGVAELLLYEKHTRADGVIEHTHYISAGGRLVGYYRTYSDATAPVYRFFYADHHGSPSLVTNEQSVAQERLAYEPYGKRRNPSGADDPENSLDPVSTDRGYTGHEHLDDVALIHMNGRLYDPALARFISPDPIVQAPGELFSYNRYAYGLNNPLGTVD